jgi:hypothetical protein
VTYDGKKSKPHISIEPSRGAKSVISSAKTKDDATVYLSGTFAPAVGATPDYTTDSKVNQPLTYFG